MIDYEPVLIVITPVIAASIISFLLPFLKTERLQEIPKLSLIHISEPTRPY